MDLRSGENDAPNIEVVFMNCSMVYCGTGRVGDGVWTARVSSASEASTRAPGTRGENVAETREIVAALLVADSQQLHRDMVDPHTPLILCRSLLRPAAPRDATPNLSLPRQFATKGQR